MSVVEKAKELADAISECDELKELRSAEARMTLDPAAQDILKEFQEKQREFYELQMTGGELNDTQKADVKRIEAAMSNNQYISAFVAAQGKFEELLKSVNVIIGKAISGDDSGCGCAGECGPDCTDSGCGGCN